MSIGAVYTVDGKHVEVIASGQKCPGSSITIRVSDDSQVISMKHLTKMSFPTGSKYGQWIELYFGSDLGVPAITLMYHECDRDKGNALTTRIDNYLRQ
jgi:hypothetical protein